MPPVKMESAVVGARTSALAGWASVTRVPPVGGARRARLPRPLRRPDSGPFAPRVPQRASATPRPRTVPVCQLPSARECFEGRDQE